MKDLKEFEISFIGLKEGEHQFEFKIEKAFFDFFEYDEFYSSNVKVDLLFTKKPTVLELDFNVFGTVEVACDLTNEVYNQIIESTFSLIVKFGNEFNDENEEMLIIPHSEYRINIAQYIYEAIVLAVPLKKIHPGVEDGTLKSEILEKLKEFEINEEPEIKEDNKDIDPRWNKLKDILIEKNTSDGTS
jgi:uncharacterized metal-binding protein YceD (DUF177 family)